ncbi:hypothetical protein CTEN210_08977 [Chaetoceros tenuissimus]|uniref:MYND-type domain-containing protein n=1 Tax=Chaetoceros tenuissimus TaxID=426638 RepID=A0AAD3H6X6_9STRA|nr:hypothetical protein CTEN210_08977 [Chaetoceros tenuissimus]
MSRKQWTNQMRTKSQVDVNNLHQYRHVPLAPKTSDPEALNLDEASDIFQIGVKNARDGDLKAACPQIATAFLLDGRSVNFVPMLPPGSSEELQLLVVDAMLLYKLVELDHVGLGSNVIKVMLGQYLGHIPGEGQTMIAAAVKSIDWLIGVLEKQPFIEHPDSGILGGCLTRAVLYYLRSSFQMSLGNMKRAIKDLSSSLKCDPSYTRARDARASLWASNNMKNNGVVHREYLRIVKESHPDCRAMEVSYAWLALTTLRDPTLGTLAEAKEYYKKSIQASIRQQEIYGEKSYREPPSVSLLKSEFEKLRTDPTATKMREDLDKLAATKSESGDSVLKVMEVVNEDKKHLCLTCGKQEQDDGSKLMKCARCKSVSYCSRECQVKDWKEHKSYCKIATTKSEEEKDAIDQPSVRLDPLKNLSLGEKAPNPEDLKAKEPLDQIVSASHATYRLLQALRKLDSAYGKFFAKWWHGLKPKQRENALLEVTNKTLARNQVSFKFVATALNNNPGSGHGLFEYNIETLSGKCECAGACSHHFDDFLLHEVHEWVNNTNARVQEHLELVSDLKKRNIFPDLFQGELSIMVPEEDGWRMNEPMAFTDACPKDEKDKYYKYIEEGKVLDGSVGLYTIFRRNHALGLLIKLYDKYQHDVRRVISTYPYEAIMGCNHCGRSCESDSAVNCKTCVIGWFCCQGCMNAANHKRCPVGIQCDSAVIFS